MSAGQKVGSEAEAAVVVDGVALVKDEVLLAVRVAKADVALAEVDRADVALAEDVKPAEAALLDTLVARREEIAVPTELKAVAPTTAEELALGKIWADAPVTARAATAAENIDLAIVGTESYQL